MRNAGGRDGTDRRAAIAAGPIAAGLAAVLAAMGRPAICACGRIEAWHGGIDAGTSQHLLDWYSPSHLIHGLIFFAAGHALLPRLRRGWRLVIALAIEAAWEVAENSPAIIDRYRTATVALGYRGDTIVNSLADMACMAGGFWLAGRLPWRAALALGVTLELLTLAVIRDNLTLNVLMLLSPIAAVRDWQAAL